ncbi:MAG: hypothetical protein ABIR32_08485 [Ilumatobacteraceae bacterium]
MNAAMDDDHHDHHDRAAITQSGHDASLHALRLAEYALSTPAPRRERTWRHRLATAVDALADAIEQQIADNDDSIGLLAEIALTQPEHVETIDRLRDEQRALRIAIASLREQLDEHAELPIDTTSIRDQFACVALNFHQHRNCEAEIINSTLGIGIDVTKRHASRK